MQTSCFGFAGVNLAQPPFHRRERPSPDQLPEESWHAAWIGAKAFMRLLQLMDIITRSGKICKAIICAFIQHFPAGSGGKQ
jgi:hypothetical protein